VIDAVTATTDTSSTAAIAAFVESNAAPVAGQTFTLTTSADSGTSFTGGSGDDTFNAVVGTNGLTTNGTTLNPGDNLTGGAGTDTLNISVAGTHTGTDHTVSAVTLSGIERIVVNNFQTDDTLDEVFNLSTATGVTAISIGSSSASGDTQFNNVAGLVSAEMKYGAGDLSITYANTAVSGSADTQTLALTGVTAGTFTVAPTSGAESVETIAITSSGGTRNVLTAITNNADTTKITVAGDTALTLGTVGAAVTSLDASSNTGGITATLSATTTTAVIGSSGNDIITSGTVLTTGSVAAGDGTDTLVTTADTVLASSTLGAKYTGFETLSVSTSGTTANGTRAQDVSLVAGITSLNASTTATTANGDTTHGVTFSNLPSTTNTLSITGLANADTTATDDYSVTVTASRAANTTSDAMTVNLGTSTAASGATAVGLDSGAGAVILDVTLANEESITINSLGASGSNFIDDLTNTSATSMTFTGARPLTVDSMTSTVVTSINASAMTAAFINATANAGAVASTISGGSGNDSLIGGSAADSISGNAGHDSITAAAGNDIVDGGAGNDTIVGDGGTDSLSGGDGDDTFNVTTTTDFIGLSAVETVAGGAGNDNLQFSQTATAISLVAADLAAISSIETITINGTSGAGSITLSDAVYTANGVATLRIVDGDLTTAAGTLTVDAAALTGTNAIHVTANTATGINDTLTGGAGADTFVFSTTAGLESTDTVVGGAGTDVISLTATAAVTANLTGVRTVESIVTTGNGGDVSITVGSDSTIAATGTLTVDASSVTNSAYDLLYDGSAETTSTTVQSVTGTAGDDTITGGSGNDVIVGGDGADSITGGAGIDNLSGGAGNDRFVVATTGTGFVSLSAAETVSGGTGTDTLEFAAGIVTIAVSDLAGLSSIEEIEIQNTTQVASLTLTDAVFTSNGVTSLLVDAATMTSGVLTLSASGLSAANSVRLDISAITNSAANVINLGAGNDTVLVDQIALDGGTTISGGTGNDTITIELDTGNAQVTLASTVTGFETINFATAGVADNYSLVTVDANVASGASLYVNGSNLSGTLTFVGSAETNGTFSLVGGSGADALTGGEKIDTLIGGAGADTLTGGLLADVLTGNSGADVFVFAAPAQSSSSNTDTITDFTGGLDKLNITLNYGSINSDLTVDALVRTARAGTSLIQDNLSGARGEAVYDTSGQALYVNFNADNLLTSSDYKIAIGAAATATATISDGDINFVITGGGGADTITAGGGADTIDGGGGADAIYGGNGIDSLTGSGGSDDFNFTSTAGSSNYDVIADFTTTADNFRALQTTYGWNSTDNTTTVLLATGATLKAADVAGDSNIMTISTNVGTTYANFVSGVATYSTLKTAAATAMGLTGALDAAAVVLVAIDDGTSTGLWRFVSDDAATDDATAATEIELMAILTGVADATALVVGDFLFT